MSGTTMEETDRNPTEADGKAIHCRERQRLHKEIRMMIRDCNALILGAMEIAGTRRKKWPVRIASFITRYLSVCDDYYSGTNKSLNLPEVRGKFQRMVESAVKMRSKIMVEFEGITSQRRNMESDRSLTD